jgi:hypothetical protein
MHLAVGIEWRAVHRVIAGSAVPGGVASAALAVTRDVADQDLIGAEEVPAPTATAGSLRNPLAVGSSDQLTLVHLWQHIGSTDMKPCTLGQFNRPSNSAHTVW